MRIRVGVIFGGETVEHEVSIISAVQAMTKMDQEKYEIIPIYITKSGEWYTGDMLKDIDYYGDLDLLKKYAKNVVLYKRKGSFVLQSKGLWKKIVKELDIAFPIVHGTNVEDGVLQGYLQTIGIPYVGPDTYAAVVGQDKVYMKSLWLQEKLPMTNFVWFYDSEYKDNQTEIVKKVNKLKYPLIVKPASTGSSVGIQVVHKKEELIPAIDEATQYDNKIIVEELVENLKEVNISVLGNIENTTLSEIEEVLPSRDFLTYEDKYIGNGKIKGKGGLKQPVKTSKGMLSASRKIPANISEKLRKEVEEVATTAFKTLGSSGCCRIDFLIDEKAKKVYINEINSIPGSLAFYLWEAKGINYTSLLDDMISISIKDYKKRCSKTHSFDSNILAGFQGTKGLKGMKGKLGS